MEQTKKIALYDIARNREVIFVETMNELNSRVKLIDISPYNLVRKSALLRLLVIDGSRFYNVINRIYRQKISIKLTYSPHQGHSLSTFDDPNSGFITYIYFHDENGEECDLSKFLKLPAIKINNPQLKDYLKENRIAEEYSIEELIKLIANAHGGVHFENWDNVSGFMETNSSSPFNINSNSKMHDLIDNAAGIIYKMLEPLYKIVCENIKTTEPIAHEATTFIIVNNEKLKLTSTIGGLRNDPS